MLGQGRISTREFAKACFKIDCFIFCDNLHKEVARFLKRAVNLSSMHRFAQAAMRFGCIVNISIASSELFFLKLVKLRRACELQFLISEALFYLAGRDT